MAIFAVASSAARFLGDALALGEARASVLIATALVVIVATSSIFCAFLGGEALTLGEALALGGVRRSFDRLCLLRLCLLRLCLL